MRRTSAVRREGGVATKAKGKGAPVPPLDPPSDLSQLPCVTTADRLARIQLLGRRVQEHIQAAAAIGAEPGTSAESRDRAVALFMERLVFLERALAQTLEDLRLG